MYAPKAVKRPICVGASDMLFLIPELGKEDLAAGIDEAAAVAGNGGIVVTANRPVNRA